MYERSVSGNVHIDITTGNIITSTGVVIVSYKRSRKSADWRYWRLNSR